MIYMTTYNIDNKVPNQASIETEFKSLDEVVDLMGADHINRGLAMVIYGDNYSRTCFSKIRIKADELV